MSDEKRAENAGRMGSLSVRGTRDGDTYVIALLGELDLDGAPAVEEELRRSEDSDATSIVVDLRRLEFIDSTGIRLVVMAAKRCEEGRLKLLRGPRQVHRVFEITDLADRLPFADA
ncbi:MAG: anti-sigma factor antagonist [Solirubrobacteraceae bacterium]|jgi:anti-anti-sigma factor|nr:anti-sigma factor antagonist [Solirubrobacteraceae bacterium]